MKRIVVFLVFCVAACAPEMTPPVGLSQAQVQQDRAQCAYEGVKATANGGSGVEQANVEIGCLRLRGYHY